MAKIGEGSLEAFGRQGLRELRASLYPDSNVAQPAEYGMYGTKTPGEIAEDRRDETRNLDEEPTQGSVLESRLEAAKSRESQRERTHERERD